MTDNYTILIQKLDEFIRKYYKNQLIRGAIYFVSALLAFFLLTNSIEYFARLEPLARTILFYSYVLVNFLILCRFVLIPLFKLYRIGKLISHEQAAQIIGTHFGNVRDRLLNTLQLKKMQDFNPENAGLIQASITQKINNLKPVPFSSAIDLSKNKKYFRYIFPPLIIILILLIAAPSFITGPTTRLIHHQVYYEKKAPFELIILNKELSAIQQEDFQLDIKVSGDVVPDILYIEYENARFGLSKENNALWHYRFKNLQKTLRFQIVTDNYSSYEYELIVLPKPIVLNFGIDLIYPHYIRKENEKLENTGDLIVPYGTQVLWKFYTRDTRNMILRMGDRVQKLNPGGSNAFIYATTILNGTNYSVSSYNEYLKNQDSLSFTINVIPDAYPQIDVEEHKDSVFENRLYFKGQVKDDYGLTRLTFNYKILSTDTLETKPVLYSDTLGLNHLVNQQTFYHFFDLKNLKLPAGSGIEYYFEIWDNDGINGSKSSRSQKMFIKAPAKQELAEKAEKASEKLKDEMEDAFRQAKDLKKEIEELNKKLFEKKEINWQEKKQIENLIKKQESLQQKIEQINEQKKINELREQQYMEQQERILEKQDQLQNLFEQAISEEMKKMMEELRKMMEDVDKNKVNDLLEKMEMNTEDLEKQLDRNLELFKQLEFEKKFDDAIKKIDELKENQEKLADETENDKNNKDDLQKKQDDLNKEFDKFSDELEDLKKLNESLEEPNQMQETGEQQKDIKQEMKNSSENLKGKKSKKASQSQKNAAQKMDQLSQQMKNQQEQMEGQEMEEDMGDLREIIENLIQVSFDQEDLMGKVKVVRTYDPKYISMIQNQKNIQDNLKMIEDSLFALSKRQATIKPIVNKEISEINDNITKAISEMTERRVNIALQKQQYAMTGINNLALLLQEAMNQMQQQMQQQAQGKGKSSCGKGGKGDKMSFKKMQSMQEQLGKAMEKMKEQLKQQGNQPKPGQQGQQSTSEQLARMAAQQEAIRKQLQELRDEMAKEGKGNDGNLNKMIQNMELNETDIVNKNITNQTMMRQKEILTRLLESEKAMRQREQEERRESIEAKNQNYGNPKDFFEYNKIKNRDTELLKTVPPSLKPFYKNKVSTYFYNFED